MFSMKDFVNEYYPLDKKSEDFRAFASFLALKGQTESTERDLFAWLLDKYLVDQNENLWVCTEDKASGDDEKEKGKPFDLSVVRWSEKKPIPIWEHIMEFKSERHGKFKKESAIETHLKNKILPDIYKMRDHFNRLVDKQEGTNYWQCQIFYSFSLGEIRVPKRYATYSESEKSSSKYVEVEPTGIDGYCTNQIKNFRKVLETNSENEKGRELQVDTGEKDEKGQPKKKTVKVKFKVNLDDSFESQISSAEYRGIVLRTDLYLMKIEFN